MKRDMELIRRILLRVEEMEPTPQSAKHERWNDVNRDVRGEHVRQLVEAGLLGKMENVASYYSDWLPTRLTWAGHEFLDTIRHDGVWNQLKAKAAEEGGNLPLTVIKELGTSFLKKKLGLDD